MTLPVAEPTLDVVATALLDVLRPFLPAPVTGLPVPQLGIVELRERSVGIGNRRGSETRGRLGVAELKGIRLEALVRFQVDAADAADAETAGSELGMRILGARAGLWSNGVQRLALRASPVAEEVAGGTGWRKTLDYAVLYEYRYADGDGAQSLIARIPIHADQDDASEAAAETTTVTDELARWDGEAAARLVVRGPGVVDMLALLRFLPGEVPTGSVTVTRTVDGAPGAPAEFAALLPFLLAVAGPAAPVRHARLTLPSLAAFLAEFSPPGSRLALGDWNSDGVPDQYTASTLPIEPAIELPGARDRFEVAYAGAALDRVGVLYLRASRAATG